MFLKQVFEEFFTLDLGDTDTGVLASCGTIALVHLVWVGWMLVFGSRGLN